MDTPWRPKGWEATNIIGTPIGKLNSYDKVLVEAGADALLNAIRNAEETQISVLSELWTHAAMEWAERNKGKLLFIPDNPS